jgi:hypothetical protein
VTFGTLSIRVLVQVDFKVTFPKVTSKGDAFGTSGILKLVRLAHSRDRLIHKNLSCKRLKRYIELGRFIDKRSLLKDQKVCKFQVRLAHSQVPSAFEHIHVISL